MRELSDLDNAPQNEGMSKSSNEEISEEKKVRLNLDLDENTHTKLKKYCADKKTSIRVAVTNLIESMLDGYE